MEVGHGMALPMMDVFTFVTLISPQYNEACNIYFNSNSYNWTIPYYDAGVISSSYGAVFNYIGGNVNEINEGGDLSGISMTNNENYIARIDAFSTFPFITPCSSYERIKKLFDGDNR